MPNSIRPSPIRDAIHVELEIESIHKTRGALHQQILFREKRLKRLDQIAKGGLLIWTCIFTFLLATGFDLRKAHFALMLIFAVIPSLVRWFYGDALIAKNKRAAEEDALHLKRLTELQRPMNPEPPTIPASASEILDYANLSNSGIISIVKHRA